MDIIDYNLHNVFDFYIDHLRILLFDAIKPMVQKTRIIGKRIIVFSNP